MPRYLEVTLGRRVGLQPWLEPVQVVVVQSAWCVGVGQRGYGRQASHDAPLYLAEQLGLSARLQVLEDLRPVGGPTVRGGRYAALGCWSSPRRGEVGRPALSPDVAFPVLEVGRNVRRAG